MVARVQRIGRTLALVGGASLGATGCFEDVRPARSLSDDPVVMGISVSVIENGPYAVDLVSLPPDRPRAEVLPLDTVELDALVANVDGVVDLSDAAWVLCGAPCLSSLTTQAGRTGELPECTERSPLEHHACLAGRGSRPRVTLPDLQPEGLALPFSPRQYAYPRVLLVVGAPEGPSTDECLEQLVAGPRENLWGCGVGVRDLPYGPPWLLYDLLEEAGLAEQVPGIELPPGLGELLPPNAAARIEQVRAGNSVPGSYGELSPEVEPRSITEIIELAPDQAAVFEPVISARDQQISLQQVGPNEWLGRPDAFFYSVWSDNPDMVGLWASSWLQRFSLEMPPYETTLRLYVVAIDDRAGLSWFTLDLRVVER